MFFIKFFYFLKGYVIIEIAGASVERFISICLKRDIKLLGIDRGTNGIKCVISNADFRKIPHIIPKCPVKIKIIEKHGFYIFSRRAKRHMGFVLGTLIFPIIIFIMSQFVWSVQINGVTASKAEIVREYLKEMGINEGVKISELPYASDVKFNILDNIDGISWAWMYVEGTKVRVELREGIPIPEVEDEKIPCDVVAVSSGIIENVVTAKGKSMVSAGDAVSAGDVLIAGTVELPKNGGYYTTHADGKVIAQTSHTVSGEFPMYRDCIRKLENQVKRYRVKLFNFEIPLFFDLQIPYETYDLKEEFWEATLGERFYLGFGIYCDTYTETLVSREVLPYDTAVETARYILEEEISKSLTPGAVLFDSKLYSEKLNDDTIYVSLTMNFTEDIGAKKIFE